MSSRRTLILIGAIVVGIFAGLALLNYVRGIEDEIAAEKQSVPVLVAIQDIPKGTPASEAVNMMAVEQVPLELRPNNFVPVDATDSLLGLEAQNGIAKNQIIINGLFVDPTVVQQKFTDQIPSGHVAISLTIDQVAGVAGFVQPGDEVNLLVKTACPEQEEDEGATDTGDGGEDAVQIGDGPGENSGDCLLPDNARYLFQRLEVLSVGANLPLAPGETSTQGITQLGGPMTFMVPNQAAQILASVDQGSLYMTLLPEDYTAEPLPALPEGALLGPTPAEIATCLTPYGIDGYIAGDAIEAGEVIGDSEDEPVVEHFSCDELWEG
ncbi:MAG: Flp pilus assembly protein CpaB [Actinomycetota bacterium]